ncbi:hypothetical protein JXE04_01010 [Patescibacteria group bacterium]|nr:hypothetical protein [Patescibacteria group bacterium]
MASKEVNKFKELRSLFNLINMSIKNNPSEENARELIEKLTTCIKNIDDPVLASNFQTYWLEIEEKLKQRTDESYFIIQKRLITIQIEKVMFPELSRSATR